MKISSEPPTKPPRPADIAREKKKGGREGHEEEDSEISSQPEEPGDGGVTPGSGQDNRTLTGGECQRELAVEYGSHSDDNFETAGSQGYLTEEEGADTQAFSVSMVTLGWMNEELRSEDCVRLMMIVGNSEGRD